MCVAIGMRGSDHDREIPPRAKVPTATSSTGNAAYLEEAIMISRDELLEIANEHGLFVSGADEVWSTVGGMEKLEAFASALIERCAVECDRKADGFLRSQNGLVLEQGARESAAAILTLKPIGEGK